MAVTRLFSLVALGLIVLAGWMLDLRAEREEVRALREYAQTARRPPVDALVMASRSHRFVFLSDIYGSSAIKRLAMEAIDSIGRGPGLDAVVVEVGQDQQVYLDRYFDRSPEDASVLLANPRTLRETGAGSRDFLALYHRIWQLNEKLGADRRVQVIAADLPNWPATRATSTAELARRYTERGKAMVDALDEKLLARTPRARVFVFMTGLHALKTGAGQLQTGGSAPAEARWFAARLEERFPGEVHSALVDAPGSISPDDFVPYTGTRLPREARTALPAGVYALPVTGAFDFLSRPIVENGSPGITFDLSPRNYRLRNVADEYIHLGN